MAATEKKKHENIPNEIERKKKQQQKYTFPILSPKPRTYDS